MADSLINPIVGGTMIVASTGLLAYAIRKLKINLDEKKIALMGIMGAFVFATQMINFSIPLTGSSGHIGGGILLAAIIGAAPAFLVMASVLLIQSLFFGDGGLLALGCNIFNLGFYTCFIAYPLIYKPLIKNHFSAKRISFASILSVIIALQLGSLSVVLQTLFSGVSELPFQTFMLLMQPIHLAIGLVEGLITASVLCFLYKQRPELLQTPVVVSVSGTLSLKRCLGIIFFGAVILAGGISLLASNNPDGLEWSIKKTSGQEELKTRELVYEKIEEIQKKTAFLPDYNLKQADENFWIGTSLAGIAGSLLTVFVVSGLGFLFFKKKRTLTHKSVGKNSSIH